MHRRIWRIVLCASGCLFAACPRETETPFYGGQQVRQPFAESERAPAAPTVAPRGGTEGGVLEGATQPHRGDK